MIFLAIRYLRAKRKQTLFTLLGIFFGSAAFIAISGFFLGFQNYIVDKLVNTSAHIHIQAREDFLEDHSLDSNFFGKNNGYIFWSPPPSGRKDNAKVENPKSWYDRLNADTRVEAFSPQLTASGIFSKAKSSVTASLIGCNPAQQAKVTTIASLMEEGKFTDIAAGGNRIIVGKELMKRLGATVSQTILVSVGTGSPTPFKIMGYFNSGNKSTDMQAYGSLEDVQKLNGTPNTVNEIAVSLKDYTQATNLALLWSKISSEKIESWEQQNSSLFSMFALQDALRYMMIIAILTVAGFGIYNVLTMTVSHKRKDIAILRSMGYSPKQIVSIFLSQGLILGVSGAILGILFGYIICLYLQTLQFSGGPGSTTSEHLHISLAFSIFAQSSMLAILSSTIASVIPALAAGKLSPIEIIREGAE